MASEEDCACRGWQRKTARVPDKDAKNAFPPGGQKIAWVAKECSWIRRGWNVSGETVVCDVVGKVEGGVDPR